MIDVHRGHELGFARALDSLGDDCRPAAAGKGDDCVDCRSGPELLR